MSDGESAIPGRSNRQVHAHSCLCCGARYLCDGPQETGFCCAVCEPCRWVELGSQLKIYRAIVAEMERKRTRIAHKVGRAACENAHARRRKLKTNASLLVAFGNVMSTHIQSGSNAQGGGSHGD